MQDPRAAPSGEISGPKPRRKKQLNPTVSPAQPKGKIKGVKEALHHPPVRTQKAPKRSKRNVVPSPSFPQTDRATPTDSLPDSSPADEYRALRRKYLLLEEENFSLDKELNEAEAEVKTLEDEKFALLDQLVVLEGLMDPSELHPQGGL
ncbi:hypothetical protein ACMD2_21703 [Ananas comosus]|uniref:Uncharacterized protein n=1 Tax=Ananas comosus TaxID=4615 RepID=A0A199VMR1_ANACO|nr:hypothetical protein ACMD2_21703 [Ananas comosus]